MLRVTQGTVLCVNKKQNRPLCSDRTITLEVSDEVLAQRRKTVKIKECEIKTGWLSRYAKLVGPVSSGAVLE